jgi:hypothetical protein
VKSGSLPPRGVKARAALLLLLLTIFAGIGESVDVRFPLSDFGTSLRLSTLLYRELSMTLPELPLYTSQFTPSPAQQSTGTARKGITFDAIGASA